MTVRVVGVRPVTFVLITALAVLSLVWAVPPAKAASIGDLAGAGPRPNATRLKFSAGDRVTAQVDVGSGNLMVSVPTLSVQGVGGQLQLNAFYNSAAAATSPTPRLDRAGGSTTPPTSGCRPRATTRLPTSAPAGW